MQTNVLIYHGDVLGGEDGIRLEVRCCDLWTFRDGLVARKDSFWKLVERSA